MHGHQVAELCGTFEGQSPRHGGQETGTESVTGAGRVHGLGVRHRGNQDRRLAGLLDPCADGAEGGDPHLDPVQHLRRAPAGLAFDQGFLILVAEQVLGAVDHRADLLIAENPGELLRRVGGERDPGLAALPGVRHHRTGIAGPDQDQVDTAVTGRHHRDVVFAVLAHRARVERADLVSVLVGRADEAGGVVQ